MVEGAAKIYQDLSLALREEYAIDHLHPSWGSTLHRYVGRPLTEDLRARVLRELNRVVQNYITVQNSRIVNNSNSGTFSSMTTDDVVRSVSSITTQQLYDVLLIRVILQTSSRQTININQVLS